MVKIVVIPLDERPCNYDFLKSQPVSDEINIVLPPKEFLSHKKQCCDISTLLNWLKIEAKDANYLIVSLDTILFGGIIPSRIHHFSLDELLVRNKVLREIKKENPNIKIFANELVTRCQNYNTADEDNDYCSTYGISINRHGVFLDKQDLRILTEQEKTIMELEMKQIPSEIINDYDSRRKINHKCILNNLLLLKENIIDFMSIPLDDCAPFGYTQKEVRAIKNFILKNNIDNVLIYPGADEVGLDLLARCINDYFHLSPKVFLSYLDENGKDKIPEFESEKEFITLENHLLVEKCTFVNSKEEADIVCFVNCGNDFIFTLKPEKKESMSHRNFEKFIHDIKYCKANNKIIGIADVGYINEGDMELFDLLYDNKLIEFIDSYAGWNTNSNTFGTTMCGAVCYFHSKNIEKRNKNLCLRIIDDLFFMSPVRRELIDFATNIEHASTYELDEHDKECSRFTINRLKDYIKHYELDKIYPIEIVNISFPWNRVFEILIEVK